MLVLLPPSEGKTAPPRRGRPVDLDALSFPDLTAARGRVLDSLVTASGRPDATALLGVGSSLAPEVRRNTLLATLAARPTLEVYSGVLFDALGWATLDPAARRRAATRLVVVSALWGALRPRDRVPSYRLGMDADLPGLGPLAGLWRPVLVPALEQAAGRRGAVVDCRSSTYVGAAPISGALAARTVAVRVVREVDGVRSVVSHLAKHTRGLVARALLEADADPRGPGEVAEALSGRFRVELAQPGRAGRCWTLDVVEPG